MALVGDRERERTSAVLRRHYLDGRLTVDELDERLHVALHARDHADLALALRRLPVARSAALVVRETVEQPLVLARRAALLAVKTALWLVTSFVLLVAFGIWLIGHGPQLDGLLGFPIAWLVFTWLLWFGGRGRRRAAPRRP